MKNLQNGLVEDFLQHQSPKILCDLNGEHCRTNQQFEQIFNVKDCKNLSDAFPQITEARNCPNAEYEAIDGKLYHLEFNKLSQSALLIVTVALEDNTNWRLYSESNQVLHDMYLELCQCTTEMELYKQIVTQAREKLQLDRIGILLYDDKTHEMRGTYGTDAEGNVVNTEGFRKSVPDEPWVEKSLHAKDYVFVKYDTNLVYYHNVYGQGWNSMSAFWQKDKAIGWIACDNLFNHLPLELWKKEIIGELSRVTGQLVMQLRNQQKLNKINENLNTLVQERTQELENTIENLKITQDELVEAEKLASLGALVAGVAHEINTPLGVGLTSASFLEQQFKTLNKALTAEKLSRPMLEEFSIDGIAGSRLIVSSLSRASELVRSFKKLAVDQTNDHHQTFNLFELAGNILTTIHPKIKDRPINIYNRIPEEQTFEAYPGQIGQILTNLLTNSISHGFSEHQSGDIYLDYHEESQQKMIIVTDNGVGIEDMTREKMFQPFFTTKRNQGKTGLGMSIVYNLMTKNKGRILIEQNHPTGAVIKLIWPNES